MNITEQKKLVRGRIKQQLQQHNYEERNRKTEIITNKLVRGRFFNDAAVIMLYAAMTYEVGTDAIIKHVLQTNKRLVLPLLDMENKELIPCEIKDYENETAMCHYGFREPIKDKCHNIPLDELDLVVVPGIAFDKHNNRLGRGAGYYDRFLNLLQPKTMTIGLAFDFQVCDSIPVEEHDVRLSGVLSNT